MPHAQPPTSLPHDPDERHLWLPPRRMRRYAWAKVGGGLVVGIIFAGWLLLQWSNPVMRVLALALLLSTVWVVAGSILEDHRRTQGRQLELSADALKLTLPTGSQEIKLSAITQAQWKDVPPAEAGLWLRDGQGHLLAHLDTTFLADQSEARAFLGWARRQTTLPFEVHWPA